MGHLQLQVTLYKIHVGIYYVFHTCYILEGKKEEDTIWYKQFTKCTQLWPEGKSHICDLTYWDVSCVGMSNLNVVK